MKEKYILLAIGIVAIFLRFWQLGLNPPSLTWDEVAWGYNAYAIGLDGRDEFGNFLPYQYIESFGDFKPPVYAYLDILPVKLFGLNEFAVRFPSAVAGALTVFLTYFLVKKIFRDSKIALFSSALLAISPWHVNLSRAAFEANIATFFLVFAVWIFLEAIHGVESNSKKSWLLILSVVLFIFSIYTFNSARIVAPLLVIILSLGFFKLLLKKKKVVFVSYVLGLILLLPIARFLLSPQASLRFYEVNIFSDSSVIEKSNQEIFNDSNVWWSKILHNRRMLYGVEFLRHYLDHFNPAFLFIKGDGNPKFSTQDVGQLYLWELPFFLAGSFYLFRKRQNYWWIIPSWLLLGILPAATARETPHALRIETTLPTFQVITAIGITTLLLWIKNMRISYFFKRSIMFVIFLVLSFNFLYYFHGYYAHYPKDFSSEWQYGYKEALAYVNETISDYDMVYLTDALGRPYIYTLFYTRYDPKQFRKEAVAEREAFGFVHVKGFGKFLFARDLESSVTDNKRILYINSPTKVPQNATLLKTFNFLDGKPSLVAYTF